MTNQLFSTTLVLTCVSSLISLPVPVGVAQANQNTSVHLAQRYYYPLQINSFNINPIAQLSPGTELVFTLQGTPNSRATLSLGNSVLNLPMEEITPGFYEARYTIRSGDQFSNDTIAQAYLQQGNQYTSARLQQPLTAYVTNPYQIDGYGNRPGIYNNQGTQALAIDRLTVQPVQQIEPGTEINVTLMGTPNATATFSIERVTYNQPMREVSRGVYQGQYIVRRQDYFPTSGTTRVVASLQLGNQIVQSQLNQELATANSGGYFSDANTALNTNLLPLEIISPNNNSRVNGTVEVQGHSAPNAIVEVNVKATTSLAGIIGFDRNLLDQTIRTDNQGNFRFTFTPTITVPGTRYEVSLNATQGNRTNEETLVLIQQ